MAAGAGTGLDPDRDEARRWLEEELRGADYQVQESLVVRAVRWVLDRLPSFDVPGELPSWTAWVLLAVVLLAAAAVVLFAARDRWRRASVAGPRGRGAVLDEEGVDAATYRRRAQDALTSGDHGAALLDAYRALASGAVERALADERPGRTAHEVAVLLAPVFPDEAGPLSSAADAFDRVRYGAARPDAPTARAVVDLDRRVAAARPASAPAGAAPPAGSAPWTGPRP